MTSEQPFFSTSALTAHHSPSSKGDTVGDFFPGVTYGRKNKMQDEGREQLLP